MHLKRPSLNKVIAIGVIALAVVGAGGWGLLAVFDWRFHPVPQIAKAAPPENRGQANTQDLEALGHLLQLDRSFSVQAAQHFEQERAKLIAKAAELIPQALEMQVSRLVALADNGHTTVGRRLRRLNRVAIRVDWFEEGLFIVRASEAQADLVGAQVLRINGKAAEELFIGLIPYVSGTAEHARATTPLFLESPDALNGVWPEMDANEATYTLRKASGQTTTATLKAIPADPKASYIDPTRDLAPQRIAGESLPWRSVLTGQMDLPRVLREPDSSVFAQRLDKGMGLYIHITNIEADVRGELSQQLAAILAVIEPDSLRYAILDLRFDGGGDYVETLRFVKELPKRIARDGKLFILTDHATFSAALVTTARAKYFGGTRSVILGERVGDRERFWAESGTPLVLPNSRIPVFFATGYHDWSEGCQWSDLTRCFWPNLAFGVPAGSLSPSSLLAWRFSDYRNARDTVMEETLRQAATLIAASEQWR